LSTPSFIGTKVDIKSATQLAGGLNYKLDDKWSIDVPLALPFKHEIVGAGAIDGAGQIATAKSLPFTVLGQYKFNIPDSKFQPYVGAGLVYGKFWGVNTTAALTAITGGSPSNPTSMSLKSGFGTALQIGTQIDLDKSYFVDLNFVKSFIKTTGTLSTGQTMDVTLNPNVMSVALGYRF
jgi:outer membrane protein